MFSVDHCAVMNCLFHCAKKASLATTREQSVICDVTIAGGRLLYRLRHKRSTFWIIRSSDGIKCGFTSVKSQESHKWLVHRIHSMILGTGQDSTLITQVLGIWVIWTNPWISWSQYLAHIWIDTPRTWLFISHRLICVSYWMMTLWTFVCGDLVSHIMSHTCWNVSPVIAATKCYLLSTAAQWGEEVAAGMPKLGQLLSHHHRELTTVSLGRHAEMAVPLILIDWFWHLLKPCPTLMW